jgi:hypothetical protein
MNFGNLITYILPAHARFLLQAGDQVHKVERLLPIGI